MSLHPVRIPRLSRVIHLEMQGCESSAHIVKIHVLSRPRTQKPSSPLTSPPEDRHVTINLISNKGGATAPILYADANYECNAA